MHVTTAIANRAYATFRSVSFSCTALHPRHCPLNRFDHPSYRGELDEGEVGRRQFIVSCRDAA